MDELIGRLVADVGVDRAAAEKAVGIILDFLAKESAGRQSAAALGQAARSRGPDAESRERRAAAAWVA